MEESQSTPRRTEYRRTEDFISKYANNAQFEISLWDLKIIFGQLDQHEGKEVVEQHVAITIPWTQAKLGAFFIQLNIAIHEATHGKIHIPPDMLPSPNPPGPEITDPTARAIAEALYKKFQQLLSDM